MQNRTKALTAAAVGMTLAFGTLGAGIAQADTGTSSPARASFWSGLVSAIAQRFNLNQSDVQQVFDAQRAQAKAQAQASFQQGFASRVSQAVAKGVITQDQANKIVSEEQSVRTQLDALQGKTGSDLRDGLKSVRDSVQQWAKDNGIPAQFVMGIVGPGFGRGRRMGMGLHAW